MSLWVSVRERSPKKDVPRMGAFRVKLQLSSVKNRVMFGVRGSVFGVGLKIGSRFRGI